MKIILKILFVMFVFTFHPTLAQNGNGNGNQKNNKSKVKVKKLQNNQGISKSKDRDDRDYNDDDGGVFTDDNSGKIKNQKIKNANNGNGNAYGRNKGNLSGRAFGQERARQAKLKRDDRKQILTRTVRVSTDRTRTARERINKTLEDLAKMRKTRAISESQYNSRIQEVNRVEQQVMLLEDLLQRATTLTVQMDIN